MRCVVFFHHRVAVSRMVLPCGAARLDLLHAGMKFPGYGLTSRPTDLPSLDQQP